MKQIFRKGEFFKHLDVLTESDRYIIKKDEEADLQFNLEHFPKDKKEMFLSDYFVVPSTVLQYSVIDAKAKALDLMFNEEKVYLKRDTINVFSRNGWVDRGRKVIRGEEPVKKTENKGKSMTGLYLYEQT